MRDMSVYLYLFAIFSLAGWCLEVLYRSPFAGRFVNPGFSKGPYLPLYGVAAVVLTLCIDAVPAGMHPMVMEIFAKALLYALVTTGIELLTGLVFGRFLGQPLWDYTGEAMCIKGCVCLKFSIFWVVLAFGFEHLLLPAALALHGLLEPGWTAVFCGALGGLIAIDFLRQLSVSVQRSFRQGAGERQSDWLEFIRILKPLLETPEVKQLADYKHHWNKNRLEHSLEVAWHGYYVSKKFGLDFTAAARAGLLHDLFFYDWLTEGPRLHGFRHPRISLANASKIASLSARERDIIRKHMWPLTVVPPRYPESWIVCIADTYCGIKDYVVLSRKLNEG